MSASHVFPGPDRSRQRLHASSASTLEAEDEFGEWRSVQPPTFATLSHCVQALRPGPWGIAGSALLVVLFALGMAHAASAAALSYTAWAGYIDMPVATPPSEPHEAPPPSLEPLYVAEPITLAPLVILDSTPASSGR